MSSVHSSRLFILTGFLALLTFAGDIIADSIADLRGDHCVSQTSDSDSHHENTPCGHCSCAVHNGAVVPFTSAVQVTGASAESALVPISNASAPPSLPASIDHPPQLA